MFLREGDQKVDDFTRLRSTLAVVAGEIEPEESSGRTRSAWLYPLRRNREADAIKSSRRPCVPTSSESSGRTRSAWLDPLRQNSEAGAIKSSRRPRVPTSSATPPRASTRRERSRDHWLVSDCENSDPCILRKTWNGVHYGGLEKLVLFLDLDCRFDVLHLSDMLKHRLLEAYLIFNQASALSTGLIVYRHHWHERNRKKKTEEHVIDHDKLSLSLCSPAHDHLLQSSDHCINVSTDKCLQRISTQTQKQAQSRSFEQLKGLRTSSPRSPSWTLQMRLRSYLDIKLELKSGEISRSSLNVNVARPHEIRRKREEAHDNRLFN
ncbi:hypothetical protein DY000_02011618 [Brassica cretica]|uniref:Uncharacterized protein n=1 Tax=Brassica cretica TaxID=69181 RepID=A0ABQ7D8X1_BRACR|nr:hypothetical protein DY000_02011618 [Brassica cretica]